MLWEGRIGLIWTFPTWIYYIHSTSATVTCSFVKEGSYWGRHAAWNQRNLYNSIVLLTTLIDCRMTPPIRKWLAKDLIQPTIRSQNLLRTTTLTHVAIPFFSHQRFINFHLCYPSTLSCKWTVQNKELFVCTAQLYTIFFHSKQQTKKMLARKNNKNSML